MTKEIGTAHLAMMNMFATADERSLGVFNMLNDVYSPFAKKLFEGNEIMQRLVMSGGNPMDILDYPICGTCETLAPPDGFAIKNKKVVMRCTCMNERCGKSTIDPPTLREWIKDEMRKKASPDFFEAIELVVDGVAEVMIEKHKAELANAMSMKSMTNSTNNGIIMPDGSMHEVSNVTHYGSEKPEEEKFIQIREE